jgi:hypothetical protein
VATAGKNNDQEKPTAPASSTSDGMAVGCCTKTSTYPAPGMVCVTWPSRCPWFGNDAIDR